MNIIILSGGSGKRLWPLSNDIRSKQFIKIFKTHNGEYESMLQRVYRQIYTVDSEANVTIATSKSQVSAIFNQLGRNVNVCVEPCRRDTFPAITLAIVYLHEVRNISKTANVVVCPVDPYVNTDYFEALQVLSERVKKTDANLVLMGIEPTYPSEKYGYVIPENQESFSKVLMFKEKPNELMARKYIEQGALWNSGVFAFQVGYLLKKAHELINFADYGDLINQYESLTKISFDYAVAEKETKIEVMRFAGQWKDLGTWNTLTEAMEEDHIGKAMMDDTCQNLHVINELNIPVLCMGLKNIIVTSSPDGILISNKDQSSHIKPYVDKIVQQVMYAEKSWGFFQVIDIEDDNMTIKVTLNPGRSMNYHSHQYRDEIWTIISGEGRTILDGTEQKVKAGCVINIPAGCKHTVVADTELHIVEVQIGKEINVHDKIKHDYL